MKKIIFIIVILVIVAAFLGTGAMLLQRSAVPSSSSSPSPVVASGVPTEAEFAEQVIVMNPRSYQAITSPLTVTGTAVGPWYFEANFPIELYDPAGNLIATSIATAQGEWMTESMVPFEAPVEFTQPAPGQGYLLIKNANASGLPENDKQFQIPVSYE